MGTAAFEQTRQFAGMRHVVVDSAQKDVFKRNLPPGFLEEIIGGRQNRLEPGFVVGGHNTIAEGVVRSVQRYREVVLFAKIGKPANFRRKADSRNRDMASADG